MTQRGSDDPKQANDPMAGPTPYELACDPGKLETPTSECLLCANASNPCDLMLTKYCFSRVCWKFAVTSQEVWCRTKGEGVPAVPRGTLEAVTGRPQPAASGGSSTGGSSSAGGAGGDASTPAGGDAGSAPVVTRCLPYTAPTLPVYQPAPQSSDGGCTLQPPSGAAHAFGWGLLSLALFTALVGRRRQRR
jgi:hypothetical protein